MILESMNKVLNNYRGIVIIDKNDHQDEASIVKYISKLTCYDKIKLWTMNDYYELNEYDNSYTSLSSRFNKENGKKLEFKSFKDILSSIKEDVINNAASIDIYSVAKNIGKGNCNIFLDVPDIDLEIRRLLLDINDLAYVTLNGTHILIPHIADTSLIEGDFLRLRLDKSDYSNILETMDYLIKLHNREISEGRGIKGTETIVLEYEKDELISILEKENIREGMVISLAELSINRYNKIDPSYIAWLLGQNREGKNDY